MNISTIEIEFPSIEKVEIGQNILSVNLSDGRSLSVPLAWYPRLLHSTAKEKAHWRLIGKGHGIHWEAIDEDVSVENLLAGKPSGESQTSFKKWLKVRTARLAKRVTIREHNSRHRIAQQT